MPKSLANQLSLSVSAAGDWKGRSVVLYLAISECIFCHSRHR